jgi:hypothetical protein
MYFIVLALLISLLRLTVYTLSYVYKFRVSVPVITRRWARNKQNFLHASEKRETNLFMVRNKFVWFCIVIFLFPAA